jgi:hypothetical protein
VSLDGEIVEDRAHRSGCICLGCILIRPAEPAGRRQGAAFGDPNVLLAETEGRGRRLLLSEINSLVDRFSHSASFYLFGAGQHEL